MRLGKRLRQVVGYLGGVSLGFVMLVGVGELVPSTVDHIGEPADECTAGFEEHRGASNGRSVGGAGQTDPEDVKENILTEVIHVQVR